MDHFVPVKMALCPKRFTANVTHVRSFLAVGTHVEIQSGTVAERFSAQIAQIWLYSSVRAQVDIQVIRGRKAFLADFALVVFLTWGFLLFFRKLEKLKKVRLKYLLRVSQ